MSVAGSLSNALRRRRVQVAVAAVALCSAVTVVAVANIALLGVAGGAQDQVGALSSRIEFAPAATTTAVTPALGPAPAAATPRDDDHGAPDSGSSGEALEGDD